MLDIGIKKMLFFFLLSEGHWLVSKNANFLLNGNVSLLVHQPLSMPALPAPRASLLPTSPQMCFRCWQGRSAGGYARVQPDLENPHVELWLGMGRCGTGSGSKPGATAAAWLLNPLAAPTCTPRTLEMLLGGS